MDKKGKVSERKQKLKNEILARHQASSENERPKFSSSQILQKAEELMETFQLETALKFCEKAVEMDPSNVKALELLGSLNMQLSKPVEAYDSYQKAVKLCPEVGHSKYMCLGQLTCGEEALNNYKKGIEIIKKQISLPFNNVDQVKPIDLSNAYLSVAEMYLTDECFAENAEQLCKENLDLAMAADANNPEVYHLYASLMISMNDQQASKEYVNKGIEMWLPKLREVDKSKTKESDEWAYICPISYSGRVNCSKLLIELEDYERAAEILEFLLDEDEEVVEVWYLLGWLNYLQGAEHKGNAKGYMEKGVELAEKIQFEDEAMVKHMKEIIQELSQDPELEDKDNMEIDGDNSIDSSSEEEDGTMN